MMIDKDKAKTKTKTKTTGTAMAALLLAACGGGSHSETGQEADNGMQASGLLSAFYGLDDALPAAIELICSGGSGLDGMPVVFAEELDESSVDATDFTVRLESGASRTPLCADRRPAGEENEDRTILLIGDFGSAQADPPATLEITADIWSESGANLLGSSITIIPLAAGPGLAYAEPAIIGETSCPAETLSALRIVWQGGVVALDGSELGNNQLGQFSVETSAGTVFPVAFSDLNDQDNNQELCLTTDAELISVTVAANTVIDPGGDPNAETTVEVSM